MNQLWLHARTARSFLFPIVSLVLFSSSAHATLSVTGRSSGTTIYLDIGATNFVSQYDDASGNWNEFTYIRVQDTTVGWGTEWWGGSPGWTGTWTDPRQVYGTHTYLVTTFKSRWDYYDNGWVDNGDGTGYEDEGYNEYYWDVWEQRQVTTSAVFQQTINFPQIPNQPYTNTSPISLYATASSGLPVTFSIYNGVASISGNQLTLNGTTGQVIVTATQAGNASYAPVSVRQTFQVLQPQTLTFDPIANHTFGESFGLSASASSGASVQFYVASGPAIVNGSWVTLKGAGTVTIVATQPGDSVYAPASPISRTFTVTPLAQTISFWTIGNRTYGDYPFPVYAWSSVGLPVSIVVTSGPAKIAANTVTLTGVGTVTLTATQSGGSGYSAAAPVSQTFNVAVPTNATNTTVFDTPGNASWTTPYGVKSATVMVVGGGGGGGAGQDANGGGGGGGVVYYSAVPVTTGQQVSVRVGAGGAGGGGGGGYSAFGSVAANGGGGPGAPGGSGGGGSQSNPGGSGTTGQGYGGGTGDSPDGDGWNDGGGGGGATGFGGTAYGGSGGAGPGYYYKGRLVGAGGNGGSDYEDDYTWPHDGNPAANGTGGGGDGAGGSWYSAGNGGGGTVMVTALQITQGNGLTWSGNPAISLPYWQLAGQTISFNVPVYNSGTTSWDGTMYISMKDSSGTQVATASLAGVAPGASLNATFQFTVPLTSGQYSYTFTAVQSGGGTFGTTATATIGASTGVGLSFAPQAAVMSAATPPVIMTTDTRVTNLVDYPKYRLRAKFLNHVTAWDFHAALSYNDNQKSVDLLPPPGPWWVALYWVEYDYAGNVTAIGPERDVQVTIMAPTRADGTTDTAYNNCYAILKAAVDHGVATNLDINYLIGNITVPGTYGFIVPEDVTITSTGRYVPALSTGTPVTGCSMTIVNRGIIQGAVDGDAIFLRIPTTIDDSYSNGASHALIKATGAGAAVKIDYAGALTWSGGFYVEGPIVSTVVTIPQTTQPAASGDPLLKIHRP